MCNLSEPDKSSWTHDIVIWDKYQRLAFTTALLLYKFNSFAKVLLPHNKYDVFFIVFTYK